MTSSMKQLLFTRLFVLFLLTVNCSRVEAEVINENIANCGKYFYQDKPPIIPMKDNAQRRSLKAICQKYENKPYYATLFDTETKIPVYSAYRGEDKKGEGKRMDVWHNEPQLENPKDDNKNMKRIEKAVQRTYKHQLTNVHYERLPPAIFNKGHLNPVSHHKDQPSIDATFTHTNAVPLYDRFNKRVWYNDVEKLTKNDFMMECNFTGAKKYIVTGAVPSREEESLPDGNRVNVPSHMWSAVCCDTSTTLDKNERRAGWSVGYLGKNQEVKEKVKVLPVAKLNDELAKLYKVEMVKIFHDYKWNRPGPKGGQNTVKKPGGNKPVKAGRGRNVVENCNFNGNIP